MICDGSGYTAVTRLDWVDEQVQRTAGIVSQCTVRVSEMQRQMLWPSALSFPAIDTRSTDIFHRH